MLTIRNPTLLSYYLDYLIDGGLGNEFEAMLLTIVIIVIRWHQNLMLVMLWFDKEITEISTFNRSH